MKTLFLVRAGAAPALILCLALCGCGHESPSRATPVPPTPALEPLALAFAPHEGSNRLDQEIRERQAELRRRFSSAGMERLGWLFVAKARQSYDAGFYKLAEQCALALEAREPHRPDALLLRGHALHSQHRFQEAETLARELVQQRGLAFDHGLLGDILVDVGRVDDAAEAYQFMLDLKPDPPGYARAAHIRWLKGDLEGAIELMRMAARGASARDPESAAWMHTQLGRYLWQAQASDAAAQALESALEFEQGYAPALLLRARMLLAAGQNAQAVPLLRKAARANPLPEYLWALAEALRAAGRESEAGPVEADLVRTGACSDPRTCALFLASRGQEPDVALALAQEELAQRPDLFSHDAMAWALAGAGRFEEARLHMAQALAHGTRDARLYFHAAVIAAQTSRPDEARQWLARIEPLKPLLLPSERRRLEAVTAVSPAKAISTASELAAVKN